MGSGTRVGSTLQGKYAIERVLGEGGMGVVYAARHVRLGRPVAIKVLQATFAGDEQVLARFFDEARAAASLRHPNVVDVLDLEVDEDDAPFMVMEHLDGEPLSALLRRRGTIEPAEALAIVEPILDALGAAHEQGIVHRDIKPDNVFLAEVAGQRVPKLLDFGIAKLRDGAVRTETGNTVGTPMYMAPEQAAGRRDAIGPWTDVYAVAVVLYECLAGRLHLDVPTDAGVFAWLTALATQAPRPIRSVAPSLPDELARAIDAALEPNVAHRTRSVGAFRAALRGETTGPEASLGEVSLAPTAAAIPTDPPPPLGSVTPPTRPSPSATSPSGTGRASLAPLPRDRRALVLLAVGAGVLAALVGAVTLGLSGMGGTEPEASGPPEDGAELHALGAAPAPSPVAAAPVEDAGLAVPDAGRAIAEEAEALPSSPSAEARPYRDRAARRADRRGARSATGSSTSPEAREAARGRGRDEPQRPAPTRSTDSPQRTRTGTWDPSEL